MMKKSLLLFVLLCAASSFAAQRSADLSAEYLNSEQAMREDEYATSLARRDYLRNRLIVEAGTGSRMAAYGEPGMFKSYGVGAEYIFAIPVGRVTLHPSLFASFGWLPELKDAAWEGVDEAAADALPLESSTVWRVGLSYYFFQKLPLHLAVSVSYGTAYYDHEKMDDANAAWSSDGLRGIIKTTGWNFDAAVVALSDSWYYLSLNVGMSYSGAPGTETGYDDPDESKTNQSKYRLSNGDLASRTISTGGIDAWNPSIGLTVGFAFWDFFPDDTEKRYRERQRARAKLGM